MSLDPQPVPPFDPGSYPGPRAAGPTLVLEGDRRGLALTDDPARPWLPPRAVPPCTPRDAPAELRWSLAYGANASPGRLVAKGLDRQGAVLLPARITGWAAAFEQRTTGYGAVPVTLVPVPGRVMATWVLGVTREDTVVLDASEGRAGARDELPADGHSPPRGTYRLGQVGEVVVAGRFRLPDALAYLPGPLTRIQVDGAGRPRCWPEVAQRSARAHVAAGRASRVVGDLPGMVTVAGPWPPTPLVALRA